MDLEDIPEASAFHNAVLHRDHNRLSELLDQGEFIDVRDKSGNTALHLATSLGNTEAVDLLIGHHSDVNLQNELGETPLHIAIKERNEALVGKFLDRGADCYPQDKLGNSALSLAVINNFEPAVDLLLEQNLDIDSNNTNGYTCYHLSVLQKNAAVLYKIISKKRYVSSFSDYKGRTPLHLAIVEDFQRGFELLFEGSYHYAQDDNGYTILHLAVIHRNCTIIKRLINEMSELHTKDNMNRSALELAVSHNFQFAISSFLRKGINNSDKNSYPLHMAVLENNKTLLRESLIDGSEIDAKDSEGRTPLHWAILRRFSAGIKILLSKGADVNATDEYGKTALYYSVLGKCVGLMEKLVDKGADINCRNIYGISPIHIAVMGNFQSGVNLLLTKGADVSVRDNNRNTVLHSAVLSKHSNINKMIKMLLMLEGIDLDAQNTDNDTALNLAAQEGLESIVVLLLDRGVNINLQNDSSFSPLHTAICQNKDKLNTKIIKKLCEMGADMEIRTSNSDKPLHLAAYHKYTQVVRLLLENGALVNCVGSEGNTALHYAVIQSSDQEESRLIVDLLLNKEADLTIRNRQGQTVIHTASFSGFASVVNLLIERGADVHELDNSHSSVLHKAVSAESKNKMLVEHLISLGVDINLKDSSGRSPLQWAVENSFGEAVKLLLENGANVNETDNDGQFILPIASSLPTGSILESLLNHGTDINQKNTTGTALHSAVLDKRYQNVKLLLKYKINVNDVNSDGDTAFHKAFSDYFNKLNMTDLDIIKLLIDHGADINAKKICGRTILHMNSDLTVVKLLLNNNAKISEQDNEGNTPLHYAISRKNVEIVNLLIESGANLYLKNNKGRSILHLAVKRYLKSCLDLILKNYLEINAQDIKGNTCLHYAVSNRYFDILKILLLNKNIDVSIKNEDKVTATCLAALKDFQSGVRLLLERETQVSESNVCKEEELLLAVLKRNRKLTKRHIRRNIDINYKKTTSALHLAVLRNFYPGVELLVESGANVNDKDMNGNTPLHLAAFVKSARIMNILLSNGANLHGRNENNRTAIHLASLADFSDGVELLLDQGDVLNRQDCDGNTPLHLAFNNVDSAFVLINNGARMDITNRHDNSFSSMRLKSDTTFWKIENILTKLKTAFPENTTSDFTVHRNHSEDDIAPLETELKEEVSKLKSRGFCGKSLLDVLAFHKDPRFVLIDQLKAVIDLTSLEDDFPNYASMIKARLKRLERRNDLLSVASTLPICTENCDKSIIVLPTEIKRKIMSELSSEELVSVLEAFV